MKSRIFNLNWADFNHKDPEQRKQLAGALQYFCSLPNQFIPPQLAGVQEFVKTHGDIRKAQVQMFTLPSDFPVYESAIQVVQKYHLTNDYDNGYEQIFDVRDFSGTKASGFDVSIVQSGLAFKQIKPGEKVKVYQAKGDKERCYFAYYGGALGWFRGLFEDQEWWTIEDNAIEFRNKAYSTRAAVYYALIEAAADMKGCCAVVPADPFTINQDAASIAKSINYAAQQILINNKDTGLNLNPQTTQFIVLTPIQMRGRVRMALSLQLQPISGGDKIIDYNFVQLTSMMLTNPNRVMVILPKYGFKAGYRMDLTLFDDFDILSYTDTVAGWMRYGGCIGNLSQLECIEFSATSGSCPTAPGDVLIQP